MVNNKYISQQEADEAYNQELNLIGKIEKNNSRTILYYQDAVLKELKKLTNLPGSVLKNGGLKIFTNLDVQAQLNLEESLMVFLPISKYVSENPEPHDTDVEMYITDDAKDVRTWVHQRKYVGAEITKIYCNKCDNLFDNLKQLKKSKV